MYVFEGRRNDPYGFWTVIGKAGKKDIPVDGQFTSCDDAIKAVEKALNTLGVENKEII